MWAAEAGPAHNYLLHLLGFEPLTSWLQALHFNASDIIFLEVCANIESRLSLISSLDVKISCFACFVHLFIMYFLGNVTILQKL